GELIDARDTAQIQSALKRILADRGQWERYSDNGITGVREHHSWAAHSRRYLAALATLGVPTAAQHRSAGRTQTSTTRSSTPPASGSATSTGRYSKAAGHATAAQPWQRSSSTPASAGSSPPVGTCF